MPWPRLIPFAQTGDDFFRRWGRSMRSFSGSVTVLLVIVAAVVLAIVLVRWYGRRRQRPDRHMKDDPVGLFRELIKAHRLEPAEKSVLEAAAAAQEMRDPAALFARPGVFDQSLERYVRAIDDDGLRRRAAREVAALRLKLFGPEIAGTRTSAYGDGDYKPLLD